ncbi:UNVERIFIED_CONTAM: hypothetical protein Sradi_0531600 [Sesamum radiatum]|uniref:DDE Tnp4 domain-containing protein n=1 Tax=Sesamum radiatum TaxID=300843 RepID=A0AAW2VMR6_SESRA
MKLGPLLCALIVVDQITTDVAVALALFAYVLEFLKTRLPNNRRCRPLRYNLRSRIPQQIRHLCRLIEYDDMTCLRNLRMDRQSFGRLCYLLQQSGGISDTRFVTVSEQVAMFLSILAHHKKNWVVKHDFIRSGRTGCLGAFDGIFIDVRVGNEAKGRYRTRKGHVSVNVLGVCNPNMQFIYVLSGWEGSAADSRVLRDALNRRNGLRVPTGNYYLCDNGYSNAEGFLTPYRGVRYHLREWDRGAGGPQNPQEYFNLKHSSASNVIERAFGLLKVRWAVLRSPSYYPIKTQNKIILACCLLHNFIRAEMPNDPFELEIIEPPECGVESNVGYISSIDHSNSWSTWRDDLASSMYHEWRSRRD